MSEVAVLQAAAEKLLAGIDQRCKDAADHLGVEVEDLLVHVDHTQLRVAVHRLELFAEHVERIITDFHVIVPPTPTSEDEDVAAEEDDGLDALSRNDLNKRAEELGIEAPSKLGNKDAVVAAIREVLAAADADGSED